MSNGAPPDQEGRLESYDRFRAVLQIAGSVVAPTTLLTALLYYFGRAHAYWFFEHFGVDISLVGLNTQDYVLRSVDALFVPIVVLLTLSLFLLWAQPVLTAQAFGGREGHERLSMAGKVLTVVGLVIFGVGSAGLFLPALKQTYHPVYPISLGTGTLLVMYALSLQRRARVGGPPAGGLRTASLLEGTAAFLLVALSLFWASTNYAADVGEARAIQYEQELENLPRATLYSKEPLGLGGPTVEPFVCSESDAGYLFRYEGLRLMLRSGGHYFFLSEDWTHRSGVAMVVPERDAVRLDFSRADVPERQAC